MNSKYNFDILITKLSARRSGNGWIARCPAHHDTKPSLSLTITPNGKFLWKCFSGCSQMQVFNALNEMGVFKGVNYDRSKQ